MIRNGNRYVKQVILGDVFLKDTGNNYTFVSQRRYKGKMDEDGNQILAPGATVTLQIMSDHSDPVKDRDGREMDSNVLECFDVTIVGCDFPLPFTKGSMVKLSGFMPDYSYYINFDFILRFRGIEAINNKEKE